MNLLIVFLASTVVAEQLYPTECYNEDTNATCGIFKADNREFSRVFGGEEAESGMWPWLALIKQYGKDQFCTASFISATWVISAAHCIQVIYYD